MLEVKNLTKVYYPKKGVPVTALSGISLAFEETGMVFVLGKSGSGKSTFLNLVGGLDTITSGDVVIKGKSSANFTQGDFDSYRNTFIGFIFQEYNILNEFSVGKNIALALELQGKRSDPAAVDAILAEVDLAGYANRKPNELSGGQKQRVAIARALVKNPEIIMADEPTGALDSNTGKQVFETLQKLSKTKLVIIVSHDRDYAEFYGDRVIEFADGRVISDIKKYKAGSRAIGEGVSVIDEKILHVKSGHKFSEPEKQAVLDFLEDAPSDLILSKDGKSNADFRRLARIDAQGNKESFEATSEKNQKLRAYNPADLKLIRSRLPIRHSLKIASSSLKVKPFRLFLTILLSAVAFGLFGLSDTMGAYNKYDATINSMRMVDVDYVAFAKGTGIRSEYDNSSWINNDVFMSEAEFETIKAKFPGAEFDTIYAAGSGYYGSNISFSPNIYSDPNNYKGVTQNYTQGFSGIMEVDPAAVKGNAGSQQTFRGFPIIGKFPEADDEIMIPSYAVETFKKYGYTAPVQSGQPQKTAISNENDMLGKELTLGDKKYKIVGVLKTGFDMSRYEPLEDAYSFDIGIYFLMQELQSVSQYSYHGALYVNKGYAALVAPTSKYIQSGRGSYDSLVFEKEHYQFSMDYLASNSMLGKNGLTAYFKTSGKTAISGSEILVSFRTACVMFNKYNYLDELQNDPELSERIYDKLNQKAMTVYDQAKFLTAYYQFFYNFFVKGRGDALYADISSPADVPAWLLAHNDAGTLSGWFRRDYYYPEEMTESEVLAAAYLQMLQSYGLNLNYPGGIDYYAAYQSELIAEALPKFMAEVFPAGGITVSEPQWYGSSGGHKTYSIVGIAYDDTPEGAYFNQSDAAVVADELYESFLARAPGNIVAAVTKLPDSKSLQMSMIRYSYLEQDIGKDNWGNTQIMRFRIMNSVTSMLENINSIIEMLAPIFLYIGIGFAVFASLLLMNFIIISISYKKREIGILRAIGARSTDVFGIFFLESLIIALIAFIIAAVGCGILAYWISGMLVSDLGFYIQLLYFSIRQVALILGVSVAVAFIASFLPVFNTARKKPIEAIRTA
ncbi:MAG: ABC transporter ATP-binding protein/permease [Firmicutes bacterium]|nr:ABC transporter ATP-binding protein/permease [Bacillota bacterium]